MRVLLVAVGTRGDVQPAFALGVELQQRGHGVRLCVSPNFVDWAKNLGLDALPLGVEMRAPVKGAAPLKLTPEELRRLRESNPDLITDQFETIGAAAEGCDVIVGANAHQYAAPSIAERAGIGCVTAVYAPVAMPSPDFAPPPTPGQADSSAGASIAEQWQSTARVWNERALERVNRNRHSLGMAPIADVLDYVLTDHTWLATDAALSPVPATPGREVFQTGAWVLADPTPLPPDLEAFLQAGERPVFIGFGSMPAANEAGQRMIDAVRALGRRVIVSRGWANLELRDEAPDCIAVGDVSHDALFPRVAAVVHHGGAGTTAAAARAGAPQLITPMFSDQFYWASRVVKLGLGATIPHGAATSEAATQALRQTLDPAIAAFARDFSRQVRSDGAAVAALRLEAQYGAASKR